VEKTDMDRRRVQEKLGGQRWRFGRGQSYAAEGREIAAAERAGLAEAYMQGQRWARMIEAEREARRRGEHKARRYR
jgi:hypothetical protein